MAVGLCYFSEIGSFRGALRKSGSAKEMQSEASSFQGYIIYDDMMQGTPTSGGLNARGVAKYSDFGRIEGYIS